MIYLILFLPIFCMQGLIEELQRDLKNEVQKSDRAKKFARNLLKQKNELEEEIKRLNGVNIFIFIFILS